MDKDKQNPIKSNGNFIRSIDWTLANPRVVYILSSTGYQKSASRSGLLFSLHEATGTRNLSIVIGNMPEQKNH
ncbi:hypothetical protein OUZ56_001430 [Daphnia magna]|uniref:Uncharacterized protein n=1 Tax=Daphnia magna TaxID=35525 RepID=A0ABR0A2N3_9CRUS|nr:hypothetical protein OUZ56_001430 [Daphnia magna]